MVFDGEHPVSGRPGGWGGIGINRAAARTGAFISPGRSSQGQRAVAGIAPAWIFTVANAVQIAAGRANEDVFRVAFVLGQQVAGKKIELVPALVTGLLLDPEKIFYVGFAGAAFQTAGAVKRTGFVFERRHQSGGRLTVSRQIEMFDFPVDDPPGHGVDVIAQDVAAHPIGLNERGAAPHEGIGDGDTWKIVGGVEGLAERAVAVLGQNQPPEQCSRAPGEPLVHGNDGPVVLLDLLFP